MNARNFDKLMIEQINSPEAAEGGKKLLVHCCCAPCSSACLERLAGKFEISVLFYNPNIEDGEYSKRKAELLRFLNETGYAQIDFKPVEKRRVNKLHRRKPANGKREMALLRF